MLGIVSRSVSPESSFRAWSDSLPGWTKTGSASRPGARSGFGFVELGTVTAQSQPGNDRPRLFRLPSSAAIINRMGFNNRGAQALADRLAAAGVARGNMAVGIPIGISIGKTKDVPLADAIEDYLASLRILAPYADYLAINVSSPNTPGLRSLHDARPLADLIQALVTEAWRLAAGDPPVPIFVKVAPDLTESALEDVVERVQRRRSRGPDRDEYDPCPGTASLRPSHSAAEPGGLSGAPLTRRAREVVRFLARAHHRCRSSAWAAS